MTAPSAHAGAPPPPPRVVIAALLPEVAAGRYAAKRTVGERLEVTAHIFSDGREQIVAYLLFREADGDWRSVRMVEGYNDEWTAACAPERIGAHEYTVVAWIDRYLTWRNDLMQRVDAGWDVSSELLEGGQIVGEAAARASGEDRVSLQAVAAWLSDPEIAQERRIEVAREPDTARLVERYRDRTRDVYYERTLRLWVDRERARFSAWYEMFPRSETPDPNRGATFREAASALPRVAGMGFDVLYLSPVHPIGHTDRKGKDNTIGAEPGDVGSPWAIGSEAGGHTAVHPDLGTLEDFRWFVGEAERYGLEVALDIAFQCSPDHPWVREHPQWFRHRPDGTVKFAENPPKQYQDIYPLDFDTPDWQALWEELRRVVLFWIEQGVRIFRVDNPHTKPFPFWEWLIGTVRQQHPDTIFLSEAFTRPKRMYDLARRGFSQSYGYFTWRNTKREIIEYFTEVANPPVSDFFRPNVFANTPDILSEYLAQGGRAPFLVRAALAATLGPSYGIYSGFELMEHVPLREGSEEYLHSEKYQLRPRDWETAESIAPEIARLNAARRQYPALQHNHDLWFLPIANDSIVAYVKSDPAGGGHVLAAVNLDVRSTQGGNVGVPLDAIGLPHDRPYIVREVLTDRRYTWSGEWNTVILDPSQPAQIFAFETPAGHAVAGGVYP